MEAIDKILEKFPEIKGNLISILHEVQSLENYLPEGSLRYLSQKTGVPLTQLYGIATFYHFFSLTPKGRHQIFVCLGTACHVKGSPRILGEVKKRLGAEEGTRPQICVSLSIPSAVSGPAVSPPSCWWIRTPMETWPPNR